MAPAVAPTAAVAEKDAASELIAQGDALLATGLEQVKAGHLKAARKDFDAAVELYLTAPGGALSSPKLDIDVVEGSATVEDLDSRGRWQIEGLGAKLVLPRDWSGPLALQVAGKVAQPGRGGQFDVNVNMTKSRQADGLVDSTGSVKCSASQFPLAMLQGGLSRCEPGMQVAGWLHGRQDAESFPQFTRRLTDAELGALAGIDPAPTRAKEEAAA